MKKLFIPFMMVLVMAACGESDDKRLLELESKKKELAELKSNIQSLKTEITKLEKELGIETDGPKGKLVTTMTLEPKTFEHFIDIQGSAECETNIDAVTDMGGIVTKIFVTEGQYVQKGAPMVQMDQSMVASNLAEIETALELAKTVFEKQERLWKQNIGSEIQFLQAKNNMESLQRKQQTVKNQLAKTRITAPISGTVDEVYVKVGEMASPGRPAVRVTDLSRIKVEAEVAENYVGKVNKGDVVRMNFPAIDANYTGRVKSVGQTINPNNRTFKVVVAMANPNKRIKSNMLAALKLKDGSVADAIIVPSKLIQYFKGEAFVYTVEERDGIPVAVKTMVQTGISYDGQTIITEGLEAGDAIVKDGYREVSDGSVISIQQG